MLIFEIIFNVCYYMVFNKYEIKKEKIDDTKIYFVSRTNSKNRKNNAFEIPFLSHYF